MAATSGLLGLLGYHGVGVITYKKVNSIMWANSLNGVEQASLHYTQHDAAAAGRLLAIAYKTEHTIKDEHGRIREKNSYGNDPRNIHG
jgi:hypothetical protein